MTDIRRLVRVRNAKNGQFTTAAEAASRPSETITETLMRVAASRHPYYGRRTLTQSDRDDIRAIFREELARNAD